MNSGILIRSATHQKITDSCRTSFFFVSCRLHGVINCPDAFMTLADLMTPVSTLAICQLTLLQMSGSPNQSVKAKPKGIFFAPMFGTTCSNSTHCIATNSRQNENRTFVIARSGWNQAYSHPKMHVTSVSIPVNQFRVPVRPLSCSISLSSCICGTC